MIEYDEDIGELSLDDLAELARKFTDGDIALFIENYSYYKKYFTDKEQQNKEEIPDENPDPLACGICGNSIQDDFPVEGYREGKEDPPLVEIIKARYECWLYVYDVSGLCSYHEHVMSKND